MRERVIGAIFAGLFLCGCSAADWDADWDYATTYVGLEQSDRSMPPVAPSSAPSPSVTVASVSTSDDWCRRLANYEKEDAANDGFDLATQQRRADAAYRQCMGTTGSTAR
jgi:hypothetical protein